MGAEKGLSSGSGLAVVAVAALLIALAVEFFWWIAGAAALVGIFFAVRALMPRVREYRLEAARRDAEIARRADQQHRWIIRGDSRGIYGPAGAEAMRSVSPPPPDLKDPAPQAFPEIATVAYTADDLARLLKNKPPCWRWAVFVSVLVQRRAPLQARLHDSALGFTTASGASLITGPRVATFVMDLMNNLGVLIDEVESFMRTPAFMGMFGDPGDESSADADGIVHTANRLMDYHDRLLALSEHCRGVSTSSRYRDLMRDCALLADAPLQGYKRFIDDFVARVDEMPELLRYTVGTVAVDPVILHIDVDDRVFKRISKQLKQIPTH